MAELDPRMRIEQRIQIEPREGMAKTIYYYSYSGAFVVAEPLPTLWGELNGAQFEIVLARLGHSSFRASPQFTNRTFEAFFGAAPTFPVQIASFAAPATAAGATINYWFGPTEEAQPDGPALPADTLIVSVQGPNSGRVGEHIESHILQPFLEWLRALTDQWWIGRSYERISGNLHFIAPVDEANRVLGHPTPVTSMTTGGSRMKPITASIWAEAARRGLAGDPSAERGLATDAKYMFISKEFRSGTILACCAFEAARDRLLDRDCVKLRALGGYDIRKHLSAGFGKIFGRSLAQERPDLAELLSAYWLARHNAAHGKRIEWRLAGTAMPIEAVSNADFTAGIDEILEWLDTL
ncbi:MAG TPA: hypothetical protein VGA98_02675 [Allosphingosinicella sp.]